MATTSFSQPRDYPDYTWEDQLNFKQETPNRYRSSIDNAARNIQYIHQISRTQSPNTKQQQQSFSSTQQTIFPKIQNHQQQQQQQQNNNQEIFVQDNMKENVNYNQNDIIQNNNNRGDILLQQNHLIELNNNYNTNDFSIQQQKDTQNSTHSSVMHTGTLIIEDKYVKQQPRKPKNPFPFKNQKGNLHSANAGGLFYEHLQNEQILAAKGKKIWGKHRVEQLTTNRKDIYGKIERQVLPTDHFSDFFKTLKTQNKNPEGIQKKFKCLMFGNEFCDKLEKDVLIPMSDPKIQNEQISTMLEQQKSRMFDGENAQKLFETEIIKMQLQKEKLNSLADFQIKPKSQLQKEKNILYKTNRSNSTYAYNTLNNNNTKKQQNNNNINEASYRMNGERKEDFTGDSRYRSVTKDRVAWRREFTNQSIQKIQEKESSKNEFQFQRAQSIDIGYKAISKI